MKFKNLLLSSFIFLSAISFFSCKYELVDPPTSSGPYVKNPADYPNSIKPPATVSASLGGYRSVTLNWSTVENAVQYVVYSAETAFDTFEKVYQTSGTETTCTIDEEPGTTKYYCVSAVNYYETCSSKSKIVKGASLSKPIILNTNPSESGDCVVIEWWMDNEDLYQDKVLYNIYTYYDENGKNKVQGTDLTLAGSDLKGDLTATVTGLEPSTEYYFVVEAAITDLDQKAESCEPTKSGTSHKIIPDAASEFTVTQGTSKDTITISWLLPEKVDYYDSTTCTYTKNPVYFKLFRKLSSAAEYDSTPLAVIGSEPDSSWTEKDSSTVHFDCSTATADSPVTVTKADDGVTPGENYSSYISGSTITYTDSIPSENRGKEYTYYIQSYTDDSKKVYTSDKSKTEETSGWTINTAAISVKETHEVNNQTITKFNVAFEVNFKDKNVDYTYALLLTKNTEGTAPSSSVILQTSNLREITSKILSFGSDEGAFAAIPSDRVDYYTFTLYILPYTTEEVSVDKAKTNYIDFADASGKVTVTSDSSKIPEIHDFKVEDGYASKFILSWKDEGYTDTDGIYIVHWKDGDSSEEKSLTLSKGDYSTDGSTITFNHKATSGEKRKYTLEVNTGISATSSLDDTYETLGSPSITFASPDYSTIKVSWPKVQKANTDYEVSAKYTDDSTYTGELITAGDSANTEVTSYSSDTETYQCVISKPAGFDNPSVSGKPVTLTVKATNTDRTSDNTSVSSITVFTLGPALINASTGTTASSSNTISVKWDAVSGSEKYLVYRVLYADGNCSSIQAADTLIVDAQTLEVSESTGQDTSERSEVQYKNGTYTFTDKQKDSSETYGYQLNQAKIQWGLPFGYIVLPLKKDGTKADFNFDGNSLTMLDSSKVNYGTLSDCRTATYGYGLNVKASKATSATNVTVEWDTPYFKDYTPTLYRKDMYPADGTAAAWEKVSTLGSGVTSYAVAVSSSEAGAVYEYAVQYEAGSSCNFVTSFTEKLTDTLESTEENNRRYIYPEGVTPEQANKGYVLALEDFTAAYGGTGTSEGSSSYYQENLTWKNWDYTKRALGPDSVTLKILNYNLENTRTTVGTVTIADETQTITPAADLTDTTVQKAANGITLKPVSMTGKTDGTGYTDGVLKVLRDARHYYSADLTAKHQVTLKDEKEVINTITTSQAEDNSVYAYRQISDEELVKSAMLELSYAFYQNGGGIADYSNVNEELSYGNSKTITTPNGGTASFTDGEYYGIFGSYAGKYHASYSLQSYAPSQLLPSGTSSVFLALTSNKNSDGGIRISGSADYYIYHFASTEILDVSNANSDIKIDYNGTITFTCSDYETLNIEITRNGTTRTMVNETTSESERKKWFPMYLHGDNQKYYALKSSQYGWWPSDSE